MGPDKRACKGIPRYVQRNPEECCKWSTKLGKIDLVSQSREGTTTRWMGIQMSKQTLEVALTKMLQRRQN